MPRSPARCTAAAPNDNSGLPIISGGATALVSLQAHEPGLEHRKHLLSAPIYTPCLIRHRVWVEAAEALPACGAIHNKAVGSLRYQKTRTQPWRPSIQKTNSRRHRTVVSIDRTRSANSAITWHHDQVQSSVGAIVKSGHVLNIQSTNLVDVPCRLQTGHPLEFVSPM